jgi:putative spermidine/putrescine transport system substrate-binding protein
MKENRVFHYCILFLLIISGCTKPSAATSPPTYTPYLTYTSPPTQNDLPTAYPVLPAAPDQIAPLITAAQQEGQLNVIALPHDWANYGEMIDVFKKKYLPNVNELNPNAGSADELEAIRLNPDGGLQAPDVIDIGVGYANNARNENLISAYKVSTWDTISFKDADGYWWMEYYGVLALEVNSDLVKNPPQDWEDLLKPEYKGKVALAGDVIRSNIGMMSVLGAGLARTGGVFEGAAEVGLQFWQEMKNKGNLIDVYGDRETIRTGKTPISIQWDYIALSDRDILAGKTNIQVIVPKSSVLAGPYVGAISAFAPHPNAARLWWEFVMSDEGQLLYLKGYAHPARYLDLVQRNLVPPDLEARLPSAESYGNAIFLSVDQLTTAQETITQNWPKVLEGKYQVSTSSIGSNPTPQILPTEYPSSSGNGGEQIRVMTLNLWRGGESGGQPLSQTAAVIQAAHADIVGIQERKGPSDRGGVDHGSELAQLLGFNYYEQPGAMAILTRFRIVDSTPQQWGIKIQLDSGREIYMFNAHLNYWPYQPYQLLKIPYEDQPFLNTEAEAIQSAKDARSDEIASLLNDLKVARQAGVPFFITGDFNEPSFQDWTDAAAKAGAVPMKVEWPSTKALVMAGLFDVFRLLYPDEVKDRGYTWTPTTREDDPNDHHDRIDFIFTGGQDVTPQAVEIVGESLENADIVVTPYPSDHRGVVATFLLFFSK